MTSTPPGRAPVTVPRLEASFARTGTARDHVHVVLASGRIVFSGRVEVPRPRDRDHPGLTALRHRLLTELGVNTEGQS